MRRRDASGRASLPASQPARWRGAAAPLAVAGALALAACGGGGEDVGGAAVIAGVDTGDPIAVAEGFWAAGYRCGDQGIARQWDLAHPAPDVPREDYIERDLERGCEEQSVPVMESTIIATGPGPRLTVRVGFPYDEDPGFADETPLIETPAGWRIDVGEAAQ